MVYLLCRTYCLMPNAGISRARERVDCMRELGGQSSHVRSASVADRSMILRTDGWVSRPVPSVSSNRARELESDSRTEEQQLVAVAVFKGVAVV